MSNQPAFGMEFVNATIAVPVDIQYSEATVNVQLTGSNTTKYGVVTIGTTDQAQQLPSFACSEVTLIGLKKNGASVYIGLDNAVTDSNYGALFDPKDSETFRVANLNQLWIYGTSGDGVSYVAL